MLKAQEHAEKVASRTARRLEENEEIKRAAALFSGEPIRVPRMSRAAIGPPTGGAGPRTPPATPKRAVSIPTGTIVWRKTLSATDAQRQPGNPTGDLRLTQARFRIGGRYIDHASYFRESVFGDLQWTIENQTPLVEVAHVPFQITVLGVSLGVHTLKVSHKPTGEAHQRNYTTGIRWGTLATRIREANVEGRTLTLSAPPAGAENRFQIDIS